MDAGEDHARARFLAGADHGLGQGDLVDLMRRDVEDRVDPRHGRAERPGVAQVADTDVEAGRVGEAGRVADEDPGAGAATGQSAEDLPAHQAGSAEYEYGSAVRHGDSFVRCDRAYGGDSRQAGSARDIPPFWEIRRVGTG